MAWAGTGSRMAHDTDRPVGNTAMATVTQAQLTCDGCGGTNDVKTRTFGLDGKAYVIDLCRKDGSARDRVAARYTAKARKVTAKRGRRRHDGRPRTRAKTSRSQPQNAK